MRFTYDNINYEINFIYDVLQDLQVKSPRKNVTTITMKLLRRTTCQIINRDTNAVIYFGYSICQPEDRFVKEIGRQRALKDVATMIHHGQFKNLIMTTYFNRKNTKCTA